MGRVKLEIVSIIVSCLSFFVAGAALYLSYQDMREKYKEDICIQVEKPVEDFITWFEEPTEPNLPPYIFLEWHFTITNRSNLPVRIKDYEFSLNQKKKIPPERVRELCKKINIAEKLQDTPIQTMEAVKLRLEIPMILDRTACGILKKGGFQAGKRYHFNDLSNCLRDCYSDFQGNELPNRENKTRQNPASITYNQVYTVHITTIKENTFKENFSWYPSDYTKGYTSESSTSI